MVSREESDGSAQLAVTILDYSATNWFEHFSRMEPAVREQDFEKVKVRRPLEAVSSSE
jgi:hypothetical protein